ncbi:3-oxo-5-alpha-steroid 4-dehydrogenase family protein [Tritrichomonas foetus]|uniref:3-oxo-5-alpha-steroid 4-dehydrogenase 1 n=1 Tax=Tritrichomonas foetus TaxID=1144522 RepID=A0A1J4JD94_9EUKA|nr:3-oxo-5-alpha-steroid 4-dehydrogenase family protein [Tritrichomonas foetus]|eukprot:OHS95397.1 3-oxo-5-alpha-steroid 4-dehydrogenase family protein [Tritrichomonas foetus]
MPRNIGSYAFLSEPFIKGLESHLNLLILDYNRYTQIIQIMLAIAVFVFSALFFIGAGYGKFQSKSFLWGITIPNKIAWVLMESPAFLVFFSFWLFAPKDRKYNAQLIACFIPFATHYFQRSFIFPLLMKGRGKMPILVVLMGVTFNIVNGVLQGNWIFHLSPHNYYNNLFKETHFYLGLVIFIFGMAVNIHSDHVIRTLRKPGDNNHYLPQKGFYKYVTSANYLGELIEWTGYAIVTWSYSGILFVIWTTANLVPRAFSIYNLYVKEFGSQVLLKKRIVPFIL